MKYRTAFKCTFCKRYYAYFEPFKRHMGRHRRNYSIEKYHLKAKTLQADRAVVKQWCVQEQQVQKGALIPYTSSQTTWVPSSMAWYLPRCEFCNLQVSLDQMKTHLADKHTSKLCRICKNKCEESRQPARTGQSDESVRSPSTSAKKGKPPKAQQKNQPDDTSKINYEGWHRSWETSPNGLPKADLTWLKEDSDRGLFQPVETYTDTKGETKRRKVLKDDRMWFHPPEAPGKVGTGPPTADAFFRSRVFFWRPVGVWGYSLKCPRKTCPARNSDKTFLHRCGYSKTVRYICDVADWYCMLTEVLACSACRKAAGEEDSDHHIGRFLSWDTPILSQLTPAHQAGFPAVLTMFRGVDKRVVRLLRDRTVGNTMSKIRRQIQENHCEEYLSRKDMYTTLLTSLVEPGSIVSALGHDKFQPPPQRRKLPSDKLLRKTYLINEADNIEDYRTQIMSTFGRVLKFDSTKKICKKLSGAGRGTVEWCTNVGNEFSQVLTSIFTCEESVEKLQPLAQGLVERYSRAGEPSPELLYIDRGCCRGNGVSSIESLFKKWVEDGMVVRLDIFHWINRFTAALRTDHHSKYALFKSALSAAVFAYNKEDISVLVKAIRHGFPDKLANLSDGEILASKFVLKDDLRHYVRRVTVGAQETFARVQHAIVVLKGPAGQDENGVSLFKDDAAIDEVWANQQKHLECIQDPPDMNMYTIKKHVTRNGIAMPYYITVRGSTSLEGFHKFLPDMIPGPHCAAIPFQVYLLAGIARWNADRASAAVKGNKGRKSLIYTSPLVHRLNERCGKLFGEQEEVNVRPLVPIGNELIGLEYLFSQSLDSSFNTEDHYAQLRQELQTSEEDPAGREEEVTDQVELEDNTKDGDDDDGYQTESEEEPAILQRLNITVQITEEDTVSFLPSQPMPGMPPSQPMPGMPPSQPTSVLPGMPPIPSQPPSVLPGMPPSQSTYVLPMIPPSQPVLGMPPSQSTYVMPSSQPTSVLPAGNFMVIMHPNPAASATSDDPQEGLATSRSTMYKKKRLHPTHGGSFKQLKVTTYICKLCGKSTQGHLKYKKKSFCPATTLSSSFPDQTFTDFQDFKEKVDKLIHP